MNAADLNAILDSLRLEQSDNRSYEVKTAANGFPQSAAKTVCAFANMPGGGTILLGIDEKLDFTIIGVYDARNCQQTLAQYAQNEYTAPVIVDISMVSVDGKAVVVADVHEAKKALKPIKYKQASHLFASMTATSHCQASTNRFWN